MLQVGYDLGKDEDQTASTKQAASLQGASSASSVSCPPSWVSDLPAQESTTFSQNGEDGITLALIAALKDVLPNKKYVEFGTETGSQTNTRLIREKHGWSGLMMDGGNENHSIGLEREIITEEGIVGLFEKYGVPKDAALLSVDIDSYDWWVLKKILEAGYTPSIIITEVNSMMSAGAWTVAPASVTGLQWLKVGNMNCGATPEAFTALVNHFGYATVYCEETGTNCFHVNRKLMSPCDIAAVPRSPKRDPKFLNGPFWKGKCPCWKEGRPMYQINPEDLSITSINATAGYASFCSHGNIYDCPETDAHGYIF